MKLIEKAVKLDAEQKTKMLKELAFFLELEGFEYDVWAFDGVKISVEGSREGLEFNITVIGDNYKLVATHLEYVEGYGDLTFTEKVNRKTAKSIVNNIIKINEHIVELALQQRENWVKEFETEHRIATKMAIESAPPTCA
ncbi:hypothetical protein [Priestia aryabhattai]|uniref:hypothetical protein n=1 Tax=Priestia aryabhattai TaxID=412384 RepID=UPI001C8D61C0|nr:hypothetical protein [Priestia aryabhattai]MBY0214123.1 hypothetical protein [Priestia aryabhattai]